MPIWYTQVVVHIPVQHHWFIVHTWPGKSFQNQVWGIES
jgi:hypothetical protein